MDNGLMLLRLALQAIGGALVTRGVGDAGVWEAVTGGVVMVAGAVWSWMARRRLVAAAESAGSVDAAVAGHIGSGRA